MSESLLKESLVEWAATRRDEVVFTPKDGFYSFAIVADAYEKGIKIGEGSFKEEARKKFFENTKLTFAAIAEFFAKFKKEEGAPQKIFIDISLNGSSVLFTIDKEVHEKDAFIDKFYKEISAVEHSYLSKGLNLDMGFLDEDVNLNYDLLKSDGFTFAWDYEKNAPIELK